jgi:hypothetical protein
VAGDGHHDQQSGQLGMKLKIDAVPPVVVVMRSTTDFISMVMPHLNMISGHTSFFQFKVKKEKKIDKTVITKMFVKNNSLAGSSS